MRSRRLPSGLARRPFTRKQATRLGVTPRMLDHPRFRVLHRGVVIDVSAGDPSFRERVAAAQLVLPADAIVTGTTALRLYGVEAGPERPLHFITTHPHPVRRHGLVVTRSVTLPPHHDGVALPAAALLAAVPRLDLLAAVTAGDWLLHRRLVTLAELKELAASSVRGVTSLRPAVALMRERVESPRETWLRLVLVLAGLEEPACNVTLGTSAREIARVDLVYLTYRLVVEYDGKQHLDDRWQWNRDIARHEQLGEEGYVVVRVTDQRLRSPRRLVHDVDRHLRRAGYTGPAPTFDARWCALFERWPELCGSPPSPVADGW